MLRALYPDESVYRGMAEVVDPYAFRSYIQRWKDGPDACFGDLLRRAANLAGRDVPVTFGAAQISSYSLALNMATAGYRIKLLSKLFSQWREMSSNGSGDRS